MITTPECLIRKQEKQQEWLRASEAIKIFPLALSTLWDWAKKGKLHPIKVSTRVTVFPAKELQELFMYGDKNLQNVKSQPTKKRKKRKVKSEVSAPIKTKKTTFRKVQSKSHEELMEEYNSRKDKSCKPYSTKQSEKTVYFDDVSLVKTETIQKPKPKKGYSTGRKRRGLEIGGKGHKLKPDAKGNNRPKDDRKTIGGISAKSNSKPTGRRLIGGTERKPLIPRSSYQMDNKKPISEASGPYKKITGKGYSGLMDGEKFLAKLKKQRGINK